MTGIPDPELTKILSTNALACYDLDPNPLNEIAARIGPEKSLFVGAVADPSTPTTPTTSAN